jgi:hypothetical protein
MFRFGSKYELIIGVPYQIDKGNVDQLFTITNEFTLKDNQVIFKVDRSNSSSPNTGEIVVYNAPRELIGLMKKNQGKLPILSLKAGFDTDAVLPELFKGVVESVKETDNGVNHMLSMKLSDGGSNVREYTTKRTYRKGTNVDTIVEELIEDSGLAIGPIYKLNKQIASPKSFSGSAHTHLRAIAELYGLNFSIQNGLATLVPSFAGTSAEVVEVNVDTGMVGSPSLGTTPANLSKDGTIPKEGFKVKTLMNGNIVPENFVKITSEEVNGTYKVESVKHVGDYEGNAWFSIFTCKPTEFTITNYNIPIPYRGES